MRFNVAALLLAICFCGAPRQVCAEKWLKFHAESWHHSSQKLKKKLRFSNYSYYDIDSIKKSGNGDISLWIKDVSHNDKFYVGKGVPENEVVFKQVLLRCSSRKYEVMLGDDEEAGLQEMVSDEIKTGSVYEKLFKKVCAVTN